MTTTQQGQQAALTVEQVIDDAMARRFYRLYKDTFGELATKAVARQLLHEREFMDEMRDGRVDKIVAWDDCGDAVGMCTLTKHLETVPWVSPDYFAHHYPELTKRDAVFYLGFILVAEHQRRGHLFMKMIAKVNQIVTAEAGLCAYDICGYNDEALGMAKATATLINRLGEFDIRTIDTQSYYCAITIGPSKVPEMRPRSS